MSKKNRKKKSEFVSISLSAKDAASRVKSLQKKATSSKKELEDETNARSPIEYKRASQQTSENSPIKNYDMDFIYSTKDQIEGVRNELIAHSTAGISKVREDFVTIVADYKNSTLKWVVGLFLTVIIAILIGFFTFHIYSLKDIKNSTKENIKSYINPINEKISNLQNKFNTITTEEIKPIEELKQNLNIDPNDN